MKLIILFLLLYSFFSFGQDEKLLVMSPGQQTFLTVSNRDSILVGNGKLVSLKDLGNKVLITGKIRGKTYLTIGKQTWALIVLSQKDFLTFKDLEQSINKFKGLKISIGATLQPEITGELLRLSDWIQLAATVKRSTQYIFSARLRSEIEDKVNQHFKELLVKARLPFIEISYEPYIHALLPSEHKELKSHYDEVFCLYGIQVIEDKVSLYLAPMIKVQITVAEVKLNEFRKLGLSWQESYQAQIIPKLDIEAPLPIVEALEQKGIGRVLASPNLLCRSGKKAQFLAGGEFPIKISNFKKNDVIWKKHGVLLTIEPKADFRGRMSIAISSEISAIDDSVTIDDIPGLKTNRIESHFDLENSKTIALSGLIKHEWGRSSQGAPYLSQIPILGLLFSSESYRDYQTELVIFVTPQVLSSKDIESPIKMPKNYDRN